MTNRIGRILAFLLRERHHQSARISRDLHRLRTIVPSQRSPKRERRKMTGRLDSFKGRFDSFRSRARRAHIRSVWSATMTLLVRSPAFSEGKPIPRRHTGDGEDLSPPLSWSGVPPAARELALIVDDPDAPTSEPWVHWVIYGMPVTTDSLA